ncbi:uncharacterized protein LOC124697786 [Lolium rigidum]|uniref:uncharacterized protein LOC124697786 n=1 Tax=Lolium rigidum TaxID=89674 RepID=UPI001F5D8E8B|nr:uncharacterized protein LOC124697786 [Lolium rigidum]
MELWNDRHHVWLRSRGTGDYLHADDDGVGVSLQERGASLNTAWAVHVYRNDNGMYLLLHSAAYGSYLAATATRARRAHRGFRVVQRNYDEPEVQAIMWQVIGAGPGTGNAVVLRNIGGRYLRANGKYLLLNNGVTVDDYDNISNMMHWIVEPIPARMGMPAISDRPVKVHLPGDFSVVFLRRPVDPFRRVRFVRGDNEGNYPEEGWSQFRYRGRSVYALRNELARRLGCIDRSLKLNLYVRAGRFGRLTRLVENLPRHRHEVTMEIVVFEDRAPAARALRHPDVDWMERRDSPERPAAVYGRDAYLAGYFGHR